MKTAFGVIVLISLIAFLAISTNVFHSGPRIETLAPQPVRPGEALTLTGSGLAPQGGPVMVQFNGQAVSATEGGERYVVVQAPQGLQAGMVTVTVGAETSNPLFFEVAGAGMGKGMAGMPAGHPMVTGKQVVEPGQGGMMGQGTEGGSTAGAHQFFSGDEIRPAPDFTLTDLHGKKVSLSDFKGKIVLLHFWATWCPPCLEEVPSLERLTQRTKDSLKDFAVLAVSVDKNTDDIKTKLPKLNLDVYSDPEGELAKTYGTEKFPETYILNKEGKLVAKFIGSRNWDNPLFERLFGLLLKQGHLSMDGMMGGGMPKSQETAAEKEQPAEQASPTEQPSKAGEGDHE